MMMRTSPSQFEVMVDFMERYVTIISKYSLPRCLREFVLITYKYFLEMVT